MTAAAINLHDFIDTFRASVQEQLGEIHPSPANACCGYFEQMHDAARIGNMDEVSRLTALVQHTIAEELEWEEDKLRSAQRSGLHSPLHARGES
jgi:hypothetical protein